ncbi:Proline racemase [Mycena indigotica]|uniref:trans-L-3-hydroxyproline dehydratase n=1 Tax=Mycena indigotica TaxID=2126181 RepID=A0A8H6T8E8_9AGAR|nr:Proline racemase [Mycena indigotica]KAF7312247.1 Proline racemase [Mycena indigotica]
MDIFESLVQLNQTIQVVDMHTSGEPTRIVVRGYPHLEGETLLEKRRCAANKHDNFRKQLMREPRGHAEMYGAILVQETELTRSGEADIGVLFCHNEGYSTMCGHATIALGRFLIDTHDFTVFPRRKELPYDPGTGLTALRLHAPCGVIQVHVSTQNDSAETSSSVSFLGVPSYSTQVDFDVIIPPDNRWPQLTAQSVKLDVAFGGAFYAIVQDRELGFPHGLKNAVLAELNTATRLLKKTVADLHQNVLRHPDQDLRFLYGVIVVDTTASDPDEELGICFFADQQIDRSPTGSGVMARVALAIEKDILHLGDSKTYHSIVSVGSGLGFRGTAIERVSEGVVVKVEGRAFYTGVGSFIVEDGDSLADGLVVRGGLM